MPEERRNGVAAATSPESSAMRRDRLYSRAMRDLAAGAEPRFMALRYDGLDAVGHYYLRYTRPRSFRDAPEEERRRLSQVIDRYYAFIDGEIGGALDAIEPGDLLVVVSGFGMQRLNPIKQAIGRLLGDPGLQRHARARARRVLFASGTAVEPGRRQRGSDRRRRADRPVFSRPAGGARHGRLRARGSLHPRVHRGAPGRVHSELQTGERRYAVPAAQLDPRTRKLALEARATILPNSLTASLRGRQEVNV